MKRGLSLLALAVALSLSITGCFENEEVDRKPLNLRIIETTDLHGAIFPYDFINDTNQTYKGDPIASLAHISTYVKKQRELEENNSSFKLLLLDNGDRLQGQPIVNVYNNKDLTKTTHIFTDVMNYMGYDVTTVGNHDVEPGHAVYDNMAKQANYPWLAANIVKEGTDTPYFKPYKVIDKNGAKIVILGLTTPGVPSWLPKKLWSGMEYKDMVESAKEWVAKIKEEEKPDVLIGLLHSGWDYSYGGYDKNTTSNPNAVQMVVEQVPGFDVVLYGHDHAPAIHELNGVKILNAAAYAKSFAVVDINLTWNGDKAEKNVTAYQLNSTDYPVDTDFIGKFQQAEDETKQFVQQKVGTFTATINSMDAAFKDAAFNDLIHELEFDVAKNQLGVEVDMTIAAPLQYNVTIDAGEVKYADMWKLYKYDNTFYVMKLKGREIKKYLEYNYEKWMNQMEDKNDHLLNFQKDTEGNIITNDKGCAQTVTRYYNYDSIAGITYTVDVSKKAGNRVEITGIDKDLDGEPDEGVSFDMDKEYKVGINSYRAGGGGGHMVVATRLTKEALPDARVITSTQTGLRDYLLQWIKGKDVTPRAFNNWKIVPEDWAIKGEEKSRKFYQCGGH